MNIYAGNLSYNLSEDELKNAFSNFGEVTSVKIITDQFTNQSKGFGFIEMSDDDQARQAIAELNGKELKGREVVVNEARPKKSFNNRR